MIVQASKTPFLPSRTEKYDEDYAQFVHRKGFISSSTIADPQCYYILNY